MSVLIKDTSLVLPFVTCIIDGRNKYSRLATIGFLLLKVIDLQNTCAHSSGSAQKFKIPRSET